MRKLNLLFVVLMLLTMFSGCHTGNAAPQKADFTFDLPDGFAIANATDTSCSIVDQEGASVGGFLLTDLKARDIKDTDGKAVPLYLNDLVYGCEFFCWHGNDPDHPVQYITLQNDGQKESYRVLFVKDGAVYDMWFDLKQIDEDTVSEFLPIAEGK